MIGTIWYTTSAAKEKYTTIIYSTCYIHILYNTDEYTGTTMYHTMCPCFVLGTQHARFGQIWHTMSKKKQPPLPNFLFFRSEKSFVDVLWINCWRLIHVCLAQTAMIMVNKSAFLLLSKDFNIFSVQCLPSSSHRVRTRLQSLVATPKYLWVWLQI